MLADRYGLDHNECAARPDNCTAFTIVGVTILSKDALVRIKVDFDQEQCSSVSKNLIRRPAVFRLPLRSTGSNLGIAAVVVFSAPQPVDANPSWRIATRHLSAAHLDKRRLDFFGQW
jgi:hypothetical protein